MQTRWKQRLFPLPRMIYRISILSLCALILTSESDAFGQTPPSCMAVPAKMRLQGQDARVCGPSKKERSKENYKDFVPGLQTNLCLIKTFNSPFSGIRPFDIDGIYGHGFQHSLLNFLNLLQNNYKDYLRFLQDIGITSHDGLQNFRRKIASEPFENFRDIASSDLSQKTCTLTYNIAAQTVQTRIASYSGNMADSGTGTQAAAPGPVQPRPGDPPAPPPVDRQQQLVRDRLETLQNSPMGALGGLLNISRQPSSCPTCPVFTFFELQAPENSDIIVGLSKSEISHAQYSHCVTSQGEASCQSQTRPDPTGQDPITSLNTHALDYPRYIEEQLNGGFNVPPKVRLLYRSEMISFLKMVFPGNESIAPSETEYCVQHESDVSIQIDGLQNEIFEMLLNDPGHEETYASFLYEAPEEIGDYCTERNGNALITLEASGITDLSAIDDRLGFRIIAFFDRRHFEEESSQNGAAQ